MKEKNIKEKTQQKKKMGLTTKIFCGADRRCDTGNHSLLPGS